MRERRIRLVVTGDMERKALMPSLRRHFPTNDVHGVQVTWLAPRMTNGVTTHRLRAEADPSRPMSTLARAVLAEALDGSEGTPADLVIAVDDLELHNTDQPDVVCAHFRRAFEQELGKRLMGLLDGERDDTRALVRARCSFHLVSPMIEAYVFGEDDALRRAGCADSVAPMLRSTDWEDFWCVDPGFQPTCLAENTKKAAPPLANTWWQEERHAKHYLEHLVFQDEGAFYEETREGARALEVLAWPAVPRQDTECALVRALFEDLSDFFGVHSPMVGGVPSPHTYAGHPTPSSSRLLRNM